MWQSCSFYGGSVPALSGSGTRSQARIHGKVSDAFRNRTDSAQIHKLRQNSSFLLTLLLVLEEKSTTQKYQQTLTKN